MAEKKINNGRTISHSPFDRTEHVLEKLLANKEHFICNGSIDVLASNLIQALTQCGIKINLWEGLATSGKITDAITNNRGVTSVFAHSLITVNPEAVEAAMPGLFVGTFRAHKENSAIASSTAAARMNYDRPEEVTLVTTGNILEKGSDVHVSIMTKKRLRNDSANMPTVLTIGIDDFDSEIQRNPKWIEGATLNSLKKQFVTHKALLFLLKELGYPSDFPFQPRHTQKHFLDYRNDLMKQIIKKLKAKKYKLASAESATGGRLVDALTDIEGGADVIGRSNVLYNEDVKREAGVPEDTLTQAAVYSEFAAYELARTVIGLDPKKPETQVQIGFTGLLENKDNRNKDTIKQSKGSIYFAVLAKDKRAHAKSIRIPVRNRLEMKEMSTIIVYRYLLKILSEKN